MQETMDAAIRENNSQAKSLELAVKAVSKMGPIYHAMSNVFARASGRLAGEGVAAGMSGSELSSRPPSL